MYVANLTGILMKVQEDPVTRYRFEVWFDYTRCAINTISEGAMVSVPNFAGNDEENTVVVLQFDATRCRLIAYGPNENIIDESAVEYSLNSYGAEN